MNRTPRWLGIGNIDLARFWARLGVTTSIYLPKLHRVRTSESTDMPLERNAVLMPWASQFLGKMADQSTRSAAEEPESIVGLGKTFACTRFSMPGNRKDRPVWWFIHGMRRSALPLWLYTRTSEFIYFKGNCGDAVAVRDGTAMLAPFRVGLDAMTSSDAGASPQAHLVVTMMVDADRRSDDGQ